MENRYLFKAKRKNWQELPKDEQWVQGYLFDDGFENGRVFVGGFVIEKYNGTACDDWTVTGIDFYEIDPNTICQCTGLKDKNGKLIWENDITNCIEAECYGEIVWNESEAGFYFNVLLEDGTYEEEHIYDYVDCMDVIGNIFDNPELLESEEQYGENI